MSNPDLELPPSGTHGVEIPGWVRPIFKVLSPLEGLMFRFGGKVQGRPLLRLWTTGARTGKRRHVVLGWFADDGREDVWVVVASNGGAARHPGWAFNLAGKPDDAAVDFGDEQIAVDVELMTGEERAAKWEEVVSLSPGYGRYEEKTDREIPLFRLSRRA